MPQTRATLKMDRLHGEPAAVLDNGRIRAAVLPTLGGKIWELTDEAGSQWIWRNPNILPQPRPFGSGYDENWAGGWEELFPNDAAGAFDGRDLPDHGEWWTGRWDHRAVETGGKTGLEMTLRTKSVRALCRKTILLAADEPVLTVRYSITNEEGRSADFLFKQHLALALTPHHALELPGGTAEQVDEGFSTRVSGGKTFPWPFGVGPDGRTVNLARLPSPEEKHREFLYVSDLPEGWCGARDTRTGRALRLHFDRAAFPFTWLFMTFGGWRDLYTAVLEPCTNKPKDLAAAKAAGNCARLEPGETFECEVRAELLG